jgi:hypothetical protein
LGNAEIYNCEQSLLGTIIVPPSYSVLSDTDPAEEKFLIGRKANSTPMVLHRISLTDDISVDKIFTSRSPELPSGCARNAW